MHKLALASLELNRTSNREVVKVAGIVQRLHNWYRKLTDPEYREKVLKFNTDTAAVKNDLEELDKYISATRKAIKDSDVESYNFAVDRVRELSKRLVPELVKYENSAKEADPDKKNEFVSPEFAEESTQLPPSLERIERVHISNKIKEAVWNIKGLKAALERHNLPQIEIDALINSPSRLGAFYDELAREIKNGKIVSSWQSPQSSLDINRNGEIQYRIVTNPFVIPGTNFKVQMTVEGTDLSARHQSPRPVFSVHKFNYIDARQNLPKTSDVLQLNNRLNKFIAKLSHNTG